MTILPELDDDAYVGIAAYWPSLQAFLTTHVLPRVDDAPVDLVRDYTKLRTAFATLEVEVTAQRSKEWIVRQRGLATWRDEYMLPLARELKLFEHVEEVLLRSCLRRGWICLPQPDGQTTDAQRQVDAIAAVRTFLYRFPCPTGKQGHIQLLYTNSLCSTPEAANGVAREWAKQDQRAAARARGAILDVLGSGLLGVLRTARYAYANEVLELHRLFKTIPHLRELPGLVEARVRRHLIALRRAIDRVDTKLWRADLLTERAKSEVRRLYRERLAPGTLQQVAAVLAEILSIDVIDAAGWYDAWMIDGWNGLIARSLVALGYVPTISLEDAQVQQLLDEQVGALDEDARREIAKGVGNLRAAIDETGVQVPLRRLLRDSPYSRSRRNFGRGLWFGMSARSRRGQRPRHKNRDIQRPVKHIQLLEDGDDNPFRILAPEDKLVNVYSRRADLEDEATGRSIVRSVGWNGSVSFLLKSGWQQAVDQSIAEYIEFIKLGHIEGTVQHNALRECVNTLAYMHRTPQWSQQLVRVFYNSIPKRPRWNGGVGEIMAGVSWRATRFRTIRRLHNRWLVVVIKMRIPVVDEQNRPLADVYYVVLVIDEATERPMGCWGSVTKPGSREVGLALYQSIWHPWVPTWHLRGIPEKIRVPRELTHGQWKDIERAGYFLLTEIEITDEPVWNGPRDETGLDIATYIRVFGPAQIQQRSHGAPLTQERILEELLVWLATNEQVFGHHTSDMVESKYLGRGVCLPGIGTPAAGWLLPVQATGRTTWRGVVVNGREYSIPAQHLNSDQIVHWRSFPYDYPNRVDSGFAQLGEDHLSYGYPEVGRYD